jgi:hypothetical protein
MHHVESGKENFLELLKQLPAAVGEDGRKVTAVGLVLAPVNGALNVCVNFGDTPEQLSETNSSDFDRPHVLQFGEDAKPLCDWTAEYWKDGEIVLANGTLIKDWVSDSYFAEPIMEAVCRWTDSFYSNGDQGTIEPIWIVVDEIDSGSNRYWRVGNLADAKS